MPNGSAGLAHEAAGATVPDFGDAAMVVFPLPGTAAHAQRRRAAATPDCLILINDLRPAARP